MKKSRVIIYAFITSVILLCLVVAVKLLPITSLGADTTIEIKTYLQKYKNYYLSQTDKGTLVQYAIKMKMEYGEENQSIAKNQLFVNVNQIDGKYPYEVKVIDKNSLYNDNTGTLFIEEEKPKQNNQTNYIIICYYDTYIEDEQERELEVKVKSNVTLENDEKTEISKEEQCKVTVSENIGELTSINCKTQDIFNGYIKSNIINGTDYNTEYEQTMQIMVSKKEAQETIEFVEENTLIKNGEELELGNNINLIYQSTEIQKSEVETLLGEQGFIEILDVNDNIIARVDENTIFDERGKYVIYYEQDCETVKVRTSNVIKEGNLYLKHKKQIKSTMRETQNVEIKTKIQLKDRQTAYEEIKEIQSAETKVDVNIDNKYWSNDKQNEVAFDIYMDTSTANSNLLKNPSIQIELPHQVEKVILGDTSIIYANGLVLQEPYLITNEKGNLVIVANLNGEQTKYNDNALESVTNIKLLAGIILNKSIENAEEVVNIVYTNQYTLNNETDTKNKEIEVNLEGNKEKTQQLESMIVYQKAKTLSNSNNSLTMEVARTKGNTTIEQGDVVYEGEYIKYNIKVTNTSKEDVDNVKIIAEIPQGTTYGELNTNYYDYLQSYLYNFNKELREKIIDIGKVKAGESKSVFYEVKVDNLESGIENKSINTNISAYIGEELIQNYTMTNKVEHSEVQLFMNVFIDHGDWTYGLNVMSNEQDKEEVEVNVHLPKIFELQRNYYGES